MLIPTALKILLDDTQYWIENKTYPAAEIAIRFKHRLVSIHCFPNGNGRHSRMMADLIIETIFTEKLFTWNSSNMVKSDDIRKHYKAALKQADVGNIDPLLDFALH
jgi:Fic-DOC domain mobile mystery protein B